VPSFEKHPGRIMSGSSASDDKASRLSSLSLPSPAMAYLHRTNHDRNDSRASDTTYAGSGRNGRPLWRKARRPARHVRLRRVEDCNGTADDQLELVINEDLREAM